MNYVGIDPGNEYSAYCVVCNNDNGTVSIVDFGKITNEDMLLYLNGFNGYERISMEHIVLHGMAGNTTRDTLFWEGRFYQTIANNMSKPNLVFRRHVIKHFLGKTRNKGNDAKIRAALIKRFEPTLQAKKRPCGILKGISHDVWSALAIAVYSMDNKL